MKVYRCRRLILFLVVLILPALAIAVTGWVMWSQEEELAKTWLQDREKQTAAGIGQAFLDRLQRIALGEIAHTSPTAVPQPGAYSDPAVVTIGTMDGEQAVWPWNAESADSHRKSQAGPTPRFIRGMDDARRMELVEKRDEDAAALYRGLIETTATEVERADARLGLARILTRSRAVTAAIEIYRGLLALPSDVCDEAGLPFASYAAARLIDLGAAGPEVLARVDGDLESPGGLAPIQMYRWRSVVEALPNAPDPAGRGGPGPLLARLSAILKDLEQTQALERDFATLRVTSADWKPFPGDALWLIGKASSGAAARTLIIAVRAETLRQSVEADLLARKAGPRFQIATAAESTDPSQVLSAQLPGLVVRLQPEDGPKPGNPQRTFFGLLLSLVVGLTFLGGYLLWRDTGREARVAELRTQFVSSVSHELKTPLTSIRMFAETLQMQSSIDPELHAECVDTIVNESERLTRLLDNVLDFSRIERGQKTYRLEPAPLSEVIQAAVRAIRHPLEQQGFVLRLDLSDAVPPVPVDRDALQQAILNLLTNAMKYSGQRRDIALRLCREDGNVSIQVTDHGIGIPPDEQHRIFEKFYRAPVEENRAIAGTGLGLALVAHVVQAHGGSVHVESRPGEGTFSIRLPLKAGGTA